jgi:hypothetical protein
VAKQSANKNERDAYTQRNDAWRERDTITVRYESLAKTIFAAHGEARNVDALTALQGVIGQCERVTAALVRVEQWTHEHGAALHPRGADTYGNGMRDAKEQVFALALVRK